MYHDKLLSAAISYLLSRNTHMCGPAWSLNDPFPILDAMSIYWHCVQAVHLIDACCMWRPAFYEIPPSLNNSSANCTMHA